MSVNSRFENLLNHIIEPKTYDHSGDKTICYLTFKVEDIQFVKKQVNGTWLHLAKHKGLEPTVLSLHEVLKTFFSQDDYRIDAGAEATEDEYEMKEVYDSLGENLKNQEVIEKAILSKQEEVKALNNGVLLVTDVEAIHPFTRFGPIELKIYGKIEVPLIIMYPGKMSGSALKFLGFYPEDGNYRSKHF